MKMQCLSYVSHFQVLSGHMWLVASALDRIDIGLLHYNTKFYCTQLLQGSVCMIKQSHNPVWVSAGMKEMQAQA